jgi:hypothetical protein
LRQLCRERAGNAALLPLTPERPQMLPANLSQITSEDLQRLIDNEVREDEIIEYKRDLDCAQPEEKRELLADITAFANLQGGHLLFGVEAIDGVPMSFPGIPLASEDDTKQLIENLCRDGVEPRLLGLSMRAVRLASGVAPVVNAEHHPGWTPSVNLDGHVNFSANGLGYVQFFRNGIIEHAASFDVENYPNQQRLLIGPHVEKTVLNALKEYLRVQQSMGVVPPIYALLSLSGSLGVKLLTEFGEYLRISSTADRNEIELPEAVIQDFETDRAKLLEPTLGVMWNAFGRYRPAHAT